MANLLQALLRGVTQRTAFQVISAFNEAFNNVVAHSELTGEELLDIEAQLMGDSLQLRLSDDGIPYEPKFPTDDTVPDPLSLDEGGLGLLLIGKCMDEVRYERTERNTLIMVKRIVAPHDGIR